MNGLDPVLHSDCISSTSPQTQNLVCTSVFGVDCEFEVQQKEQSLPAYRLASSAVIPPFCCDPTFLLQSSLSFNAQFTILVRASSRSRCHGCHLPFCPSLHTHPPKLFASRMEGFELLLLLLGLGWFWTLEPAWAHRTHGTNKANSITTLHLNPTLVFLAPLVLTHLSPPLPGLTSPWWG